jgi:hypothetical protein
MQTMCQRRRHFSLMVKAMGALGLRVMNRDGCAEGRTAVTVFVTPLPFHVQ